MKRTILAAVATGLLVMAVFGGTGAPARHLCTTGSCSPAKPALAGPTIGSPVGAATYAMAVPTIGSVDLLDCVGFPVGFPVFLRGLVEAWWNVDPGSVVVDVPSPTYAWA